jgi:hypothetical protein
MTRRDQRPRPGIADPGVLLVLAAAEFMLTLDLSIVNVALPSIRFAGCQVLRTTRVYEACT